MLFGLCDGGLSSREVNCLFCLLQHWCAKRESFKQFAVINRLRRILAVA